MTTDLGIKSKDKEFSRVRTEVQGQQTHGVEEVIY